MATISKTVVTDLCNRGCVFCEVGPDFFNPLCT